MKIRSLVSWGGGSGTVECKRLGLASPKFFKINFDTHEKLCQECENFV